MNFVLFYHSLISDWNHGNAHFLRGVAAELIARGHSVRVFEPQDGWSLQNLRAEAGEGAIRQFRKMFPTLESEFYSLQTLNLDMVLAGADVVIVHEWSDHELVRKIGRHRARKGTYRLLFHDTHHRSVTDAESMSRYDLRHYDGVLAYGQVISDIYLKKGWAERAWTWHEAADTRIFKPLRRDESLIENDLVWVGNWGDEERTKELHDFLLKPARQLKLRTTVYGVRYPDEAKAALKRAGIRYAGWIANAEVPRVFARSRVTIHVPRRPYVEALPGIPTIRPFEAMACGIPLISTPWEDAEHLFTPGEDFLVARSTAEMKRHLQAVLNEPELATSLAQRALRTIRSRHTCSHRVNQLLNILQELDVDLQAAAG